MFEHTPGPWIWWTSNSWRRLKRDDHGITQSVLEPYVCSDGHPDCSISEADMRLIAAAPDLLNALTALAEAVELRGIPCDAARAAIAKATGSREEQSEK